MVMQLHSLLCHQVVRQQLQQLTVARLELALRSVLLKLQFADAHLQPLPSGAVLLQYPSSENMLSRGPRTEDLICCPPVLSDA